MALVVAALAIVLGLKCREDARLSPAAKSDWAAAAARRSCAPRRRTSSASPGATSSSPIFTTRRASSTSTRVRTSASRPTGSIRISSSLAKRHTATPIIYNFELNVGPAHGGRLGRTSQRRAAHDAPRPPRRGRAAHDPRGHELTARGVRVHGQGAVRTPRRRRARLREALPGALSLRRKRATSQRSCSARCASACSCRCPAIRETENRGNRGSLSHETRAASWSSVRRPTPHVSPVAHVASRSAVTTCTTSAEVPKRPSCERVARRVLAEGDPSRPRRRRRCPARPR